MAKKKDCFEFRMPAEDREVAMALFGSQLDEIREDFKNEEVLGGPIVFDELEVDFQLQRVRLCAREPHTQTGYEPEPFYFEMLEYENTQYCCGLVELGQFDNLHDTPKPLLPRLLKKTLEECQQAANGVFCTLAQSQKRRYEAPLLDAGFIRGITFRNRKTNNNVTVYLKKFI